MRKNRSVIIQIRKGVVFDEIFVYLWIEMRGLSTGGMYKFPKVFVQKMGVG